MVEAHDADAEGGRTPQIVDSVLGLDARDFVASSLPLPPRHDVERRDGSGG
ncbi:MAG: hypothetical protein ACRBN8_01995 [Nannocystales bacterium]